MSREPGEGGIVLSLGNTFVFCPPSCQEVCIGSSWGVLPKGTSETLQGCFRGWGEGGGAGVGGGVFHDC